MGMATSHVIIVYLLLSLSFSSTYTAAAARPKRVVTRLLHRDSVLKIPNDARAEGILKSSISRIIYLSEKTSETQCYDHIQPSLFLGTINSLFYVNFSVGQPPVSQLVVMDTGSDLIWINCNPNCKNCGPVFDLSKSSTFAKAPCNYTFCDGCTPENECRYIIKYIKGTDSEGIIATEQFSFDTSDAGKAIVNNVVFGCGLENGDFRDKSTGVFGLGLGERSEFSIVKLLGSTKFSYCVGNIDDPEYKYNRLVLGEGAVIEGYSTPFEISEELYYITLEGISLGQKRLEIDPGIFRKTRRNNGVFIDSGSAYTWLTPAAYQTVRGEIQLLANGILAPYLLQPDWLLCYNGKASTDVEGFPAMTLHFSDGADLVLDVLSMFVQMKTSVFCLSVGPSDVIGEDKKDLSIIGMIAQQNYNVAYDLGASRLHFLRIDCELLDD